MISIADPIILLLKCNEMKALTVDSERSGYAWEKGFFIQDTRLRDIELRINFIEGYQKPSTLSVYYFQQISSMQVRSIPLIGRTENSIKIVTEEADFWKRNPLYVDKIGFIANGMTQDCKIKVEAFKYI